MTFEYLRRQYAVSKSPIYSSVSGKSHTPIMFPVLQICNRLYNVEQKTMQTKAFIMVKTWIM